jgi:PilZ domain
MRFSTVFLRGILCPQSGRTAICDRQWMQSLKGLRSGPPYATKRFGRLERIGMDLVKQLAPHVNPFPNEQREHVRFSFNVLFQIRCRSGELILGRTVDVSESGISAMVSLELMVGQFVELSFQLPSGPISVQAVVRNKRAFRYGFEFLPEQHERETIKRGCRALLFGESD